MIQADILIKINQNLYNDNRDSELRVIFVPFFISKSKRDKIFKECISIKFFVNK